MTISSYSDLQTSVANWLHRSDLTSIIPDLIRLGEKRIERDIRTPEMETTFSEAVSSGVVNVPTGFAGWKLAYVDGTPVQVLNPKSLDWIYQNYPNRSGTGKPKFIGRNGSVFDFGPYPDSTYTIKGTYYKHLTTVSSSWNALATANPDLYLFATLCEAAPYLKNDQRVTLWEGKYAALKEAINKEAKDAEYSGVLCVTAG